MASQPQIDLTRSTSSTTLRSGTGAPIFEPGPQPRIRRNPTRAIASFTWDSGPREVYGQVVDISLNGGLLQTESTIDTGTELELSITLVGHGDEADYDLRAVVRRCDTRRGRQVYGLEFLTDSRKERQVAQALYSHTTR